MRVTTVAREHAVQIHSKHLRMIATRCHRTHRDVSIALAVQISNYRGQAARAMISDRRKLASIKVC